MNSLGVSKFSVQLYMSSNCYVYLLYFFILQYICYRGLELNITHVCCLALLKCEVYRCDFSRFLR